MLRLQHGDATERQADEVIVRPPLQQAVVFALVPRRVDKAVGLESDEFPRHVTLNGITGHFGPKTYRFFHFHRQQRRDFLRHVLGAPQKISQVTVIAKHLTHLVR
jgi:hypothetical protein